VTRATSRLSGTSSSPCTWTPTCGGACLGAPFRRHVLRSRRPVRDPGHRLRVGWGIRVRRRQPGPCLAGAGALEDVVVERKVIRLDAYPEEASAAVAKALGAHRGLDRAEAFPVLTAGECQAIFVGDRPIVEVGGRKCWPASWPAPAPTSVCSGRRRSRTIYPGGGSRVRSVHPPRRSRAPVPPRAAAEPRLARALRFTASRPSMSLWLHSGAGRSRALGLAQSRRRGYTPSASALPRRFARLAAAEERRAEERRSGGARDGSKVHTFKGPEVQRLRLKIPGIGRAAMGRFVLARPPNCLFPSAPVHPCSSALLEPPVHPGNRGVEER